VTHDTLASITTLGTIYATFGAGRLHGVVTTAFIAVLIVRDRRRPQRRRTESNDPGSVSAETSRTGTREFR
jgi:hypothetical protein